jgi:hypothetical protein
MRALIKQYLHSLSGAALLMRFLGFVVLGSVLLAVTGSERLGETLLARGLVWLVVMGLFASALGGWLASRRKPSVRTHRHEKTIPALLYSGQEYCLVLRPFGYDGEVVLPDLPPASRFQGPWWKRPGQDVYRRTKPMEQVITDAARKANNHPTFAIVDQRMLFAPPGPTYVRARDDEWQAVAHRMISRAHTIVLLLPPDQPINGGFAWELRVIAGLRRASRVVVVLPPPDVLDHGPCSARHRACVLLAALRHNPATPAELNRHTLEYAERLDQATVTTKVNEYGDPDSWQAIGPGSRPKPVPIAEKAVLDTEHRIYPVELYMDSLVPAFGLVERDLAGQSFATRYPREMWEPGATPLPPPLILAQCPLCEHQAVAAAPGKLAS